MKPHERMYKMEGIHVHRLLPYEYIIKEGSPSKYRCRCVCGTDFVLLASNLLAARKRTMASCGCYGHPYTPRPYKRKEKKEVKLPPSVIKNRKDYKTYSRVNTNTTKRRCLGYLHMDSNYKFDSTGTKNRVCDRCKKASEGTGRTSYKAYMSTSIRV